jgi:hypothetical protein
METKLYWILPDDETGNSDRSYCDLTKALEDIRKTRPKSFIINCEWYDSLHDLDIDNPNGKQLEILRCGTIY